MRVKVAPGRVFATLLLPLLAGCVTPDLGEVYVAEQHGTVGEQTRIVIYPAGDVDSAIVFYLKIDGKRVGRVFQDTFFSRVVEPGHRDISAQEYWSGEGLGKDFANAVNPLNIFDPVDTNLPESLNVGAETTHSLEIGPGQVVFLRLTKGEGEEYFFACEETRETTTMCSGVRYDSVFEVIAEDEAHRQLAERRESQ